MPIFEIPVYSVRDGIVSVYAADRAAAVAYFWDKIDISMDVEWLDHDVSISEYDIVEVK